MAINVKDKLVTLESLGVAYSAEQDAREEADQALSTRIDNIVAPDGDPSLTEVSDARVSGSTTYNTLKARLDADKAAIGTEISQLSADLGAVGDSLQSQTGIISKVEGSYINLMEDPVSLTPFVDALWSHSIVNCAEGDTFIINADGGQRPRAWGFLDSGNHVLSVANASTVVEGLQLTAPTNATKLIINDRSGVTSYKVGDNLISRITVIENANTGLTEDAIIALLTCFEHVAWIDGNGRNYYDMLEDSFNLSTYPKIKAELAQSASVIYTDDDLDTLKSRLTVKYYANRDDVGTEVIDSDYTLSGTLTEGNNTITVAYGVYRTKFIVQAVDYYNAHEVVYPDNNNKLRILSNWQLEGGYSNDSGAYIKSTSNRACLLSLKGRQSISNNQSSFVNSGYYPIPIPANATSVSITLSPSTLYAYVGIVKTSASKTTKYERLQDKNWSQSPISMNFSRGQDLGLVINLKANSSGNSSVSVSGISVEFS